MINDLFLGKANLNTELPIFSGFQKLGFPIKKEYNSHEIEKEIEILHPTGDQTNPEWNMAIK